MENFPLEKFGPNSTDALHVMIEARSSLMPTCCASSPTRISPKCRWRGFCRRITRVGRAKLIDMAKANCNVAAGQPPPMGTDTTYLCVVDAEGNMVSYIQSNYNSFGSGVVAEGTGFALQNRGGLFSLDPESPQCAGRAQAAVAHDHPAFMSKGDVRIAFGIMGGWNQSQAHAQFVSDLVDHRMNIQAALEAARFTKQTFEGCDVDMESRIPETVRTELDARGHQIKAARAFCRGCRGRAGGDAGFCDAHQLRRVRPAQGRRCHSTAVAAQVTWRVQWSRFAADQVASDLRSSYRYPHCAL